MCSIVEGDFGDEGAAHSMPVTERQETSVDTNQTCKKCNLEKVILKLDFKEPQCRSCFLLYVHHKFRASLGSTKVLPRDANVLLIADGSAKSFVLLDMCRFALQQDRFRKLRFNPKILFIDERPLIDKATSDRIIDIVKSYDFEAFYWPLSGPTTKRDLIPMTVDFHPKDDSTDHETFLQSFNRINSLTSKQDYLLQLRKRVWRTAAKQLNCRLVFVPEINSDLARNLLTDISLGRGAAAAHDVSFVDDRVEDVKLVRPIRDLNVKEVEHYVLLNNLDYIEAGKSFGDDHPPGASIQNLTADFVKNLQDNYSSTVTTVFRTGDKLAPKINENQDQCRICHCQLDNVGSETLYATEYSRLLSKHVAENKLNEELVGDLCENSMNGQTDLCHACSSILNDTSGAKDFIFAFD